MFLDDILVSKALMLICSCKIPWSDYVTQAFFVSTLPDFNSYPCYGLLKLTFNWPWLGVHKKKKISRLFSVQASFTYIKFKTKQKAQFFFFNNKKKRLVYMDIVPRHTRLAVCQTFLGGISNVLRMIHNIKCHHKMLKKKKCLS